MHSFVLTGGESGLEFDGTPGEKAQHTGSRKITVKVQPPRWLSTGRTLMIRTMQTHRSPARTFPGGLVVKMGRRIGEMPAAYRFRVGDLQRTVDAGSPWLCVETATCPRGG